MYISICGLDGVGKTTIFNELARRLEFQDFIFFPRFDRIIEKRTESALRDIYEVDKFWFSGSCGNAISLACGIDWYTNYHATIAPLLLKGKSIITDRSNICFLAYNIAQEYPNDITEKLLKSVRFPDIVVFLELEESIRLKRLSRRKYEYDSIETSEMQNKLFQGYEKILSSTIKSEVLRINNDNLENTITLIFDKVKLNRPGSSGGPLV